MFLASPNAAAPWIRAIAVAGIAGGLYLVIARSVDPFNPHWPAAIVIGATLGIHIYRRARWRMAIKASHSTSRAE